MNVPHDFVVVPFNDFQATGDAFATAPGEIAAVIVEPVQGGGGCIPAAPGFLAELRQLCDQNGSMLIFDEVMTSRLAPGGAQELMSVLPDLTTLGKYLAGGLTFGAFGGRADLLSAFDPQLGGALSQAGTFNNNILSMTAVVATLTEVLTPEVIRTVNERGDRLRESLNEIFEANECQFQATGVGSMVAIHAEEPALELFFHEMLDNDWYIARRGFIALSLEISDDLIDGFLSTVRTWASRQH